MKTMNARSMVMGLMLALLPTMSGDLLACTGMTLRSRDGSTIVARTIEWAGGDLGSLRVVVPRGYEQQSATPDGAGGLRFQALHGYIGLAVERPEYVAEGLNEVGLSAGLFYFPQYGSYETYDPARRHEALSDLQVVSFVLGRCSTIDEVRSELSRLHIIQADMRGSTIHWRFTDASGRQLILEIVQGQLHFFDSRLGVLTNSPGYEWHLTNLTNYLNLHTGTAPSTPLGGIERPPFGGGSGLLGLPGDYTSPSRFIRAAYMQASAPLLDDANATVQQAFHLLNAFDIPIGMQYAAGDSVSPIPSATQWTVASDVTHRILYYRTMYDWSLHTIPLDKLDFATEVYRVESLGK